MSEHFELIVTGGPPEVGRCAVTAPFDGAEIATVGEASAEHVERALASAHALYRRRDAWLPVHRRVEILERAATLLSERSERWVADCAREGGKPYRDSAVELGRAVDGLRLAAETIRAEHGEVVPMGADPWSGNRLAFTQREPIGVVASVSAFNHPLNLIVHQVGAAVAAGCPVIVKPASDTPVACFRFVRLLHEAGLPAEWCQALFTTDNEVAERLVTDARVAFFSFIGSAQVGWLLRSKLAAGTRCALEHGGVAPALVYADADLGVAVPALAKGAFYHAGQVCVSVQRVFADARVAAAVAEGLAENGRSLQVGDPTDPKTDVGPIIRPGELRRVHEWVGEAIAAGAERICGGEPLSETCYPPTVLMDPPADARVSTQEIFGPVVCVYSCEDMDDGIAAANSLPVSFQAAVFTRDIDTAMHAYRQLDGSAVMVNEHTAFRVDGMPFAGLRASGLGVGGIPHSIRDMQVDKMLVLKSLALP